MLSCSRNVEIVNYTLIISCWIIINVYKSNSCVIQQSLVAMVFFFLGRWQPGHGSGRVMEEIKRETCKEKERETCSGERKSQRYSLFWVQKKVWNVLNKGSSLDPVFSNTGSVEMMNYTLIISCWIITDVYKSNSCVIQQSLVAMVFFFLVAYDLGMEVEESWTR